MMSEQDECRQLGRLIGATVLAQGEMLYWWAWDHFEGEQFDDLVSRWDTLWSLCCGYGLIMRTSGVKLGYPGCYTIPKEQQ